MESEMFGSKGDGISTPLQLQLWGTSVGPMHYTTYSAHKAWDCLSIYHVFFDTSHQHASLEWALPLRPAQKNGTKHHSKWLQCVRHPCNVRGIAQPPSHRIVKKLKPLVKLLNLNIFKATWQRDPQRQITKQWTWTVWRWPTQVLQLTTSRVHTEWHNCETWCVGARNSIEQHVTPQLLKSVIKTKEKHKI